MLGRLGLLGNSVAHLVVGLPVNPVRGAMMQARVALRSPWWTLSEGFEATRALAELGSSAAEVQTALEASQAGAPCRVPAEALYYHTHPLNVETRSSGCQAAHKFLCTCHAVCFAWRPVQQFTVVWMLGPGHGLL